jgi:hypothetical protein
MRHPFAGDTLRLGSFRLTHPGRARDEIDDRYARHIARRGHETPAFNSRSHQGDQSWITASIASREAGLERYRPTA